MKDLNDWMQRVSMMEGFQASVHWTGLDGDYECGLVEHVSHFYCYMYAPHNARAAFRLDKEIGWDRDLAAHFAARWLMRIVLGHDNVQMQCPPMPEAEQVLQVNPGY